MVSGVTLSPAPSMPDDESSTSDAAGFSREGNGAGATTSLGATLGTSLGTSLGANKEFTNPWAYISTSPSATSTAHPHAYHPYRSEILPATLTAVNHSAPTATALSTVVPLSLPGMLATPPDSVGSTHTSLSSDYSLSNSPPAPSGTFVPGVGSIPNWTYAFHGPSSSIGSISCLTSGSSMASILGQPGVADLKGFEYVPRVMNNAKLGAVFTSELALSDDEQGDDQADSVSLSPWVWVEPTDNSNSRPLRDEMRRTRIQSEQVGVPSVSNPSAGATSCARALTASATRSRRPTSACPRRTSSTGVGTILHADISRPAHPAPHRGTPLAGARARARQAPRGGAPPVGARFQR